MNWKAKAVLQHAVSLLPSKASFELYYWMQRSWGTLRAVNPLEGFRDGLRLVAAAEAAGETVKDRSFVEVGTGRRLNVPIALWLCGAARIFTVDLHQYLKPQLILEDLAYVRANRAVVQEMFGPHAADPAFQRRFATLTRQGLDVAGLLEAAGIDYRSPLDARKLPLGDGTVDYHVSNNVAEHIPPDELRDILTEGKRIVRPDGMLLHRVDFADHFAEVDDRISTVNFLQYSETRWRRYAGSRYNYHNRLRIDELEVLVATTGLAIAAEHSEVDPAALRLLESGFALDRRFAGKPASVNATASAVIVLAHARVAPGNAGINAATATTVSGHA
jgi:SAM-dependent methyltransferase